ncbi:hypothetical protein E2562_013419 [Oryza meyeriana var. granulata]|uniref:Uncharacterized protein n=1 Tax=Oryza meyeriana var. granulata TaxID=110450 RepID=A0A6G1EB83_9ORYZ|nr:hypothetical protein E2562_013419 [Oryza meyeriana var. granulata]
MPVIPVQCASDAGGIHVVQLTSLTLGSLKAPEAAAPPALTTRMVPRTPTMTPPNEPEAIDAWALMAGLEEHSPLLDTAFACHSFSFPITAVSLELAAAPCKVMPLSLVMLRHDTAVRGERRGEG